MLLLCDKTPDRRESRKADSESLSFDNSISEDRVGEEIHYKAAAAERNERIDVCSLRKSKIEWDYLRTNDLDVIENCNEDVKIAAPPSMHPGCREELWPFSNHC